jgi:hypothetical protein
MFVKFMCQQLLQLKEMVITADELVFKPKNPRAYFGVTHKNNNGMIIKFF